MRKTVFSTINNGYWSLFQLCRVYHFSKMFLEKQNRKRYYHVSDIIININHREEHPTSVLLNFDESIFIVTMKRKLIE